MKKNDLKYDKTTICKEFRLGKKQKFLFFWGHQKPKDGEIGSSSFSQWFSTEFQIDGIKYNSAEQYMMAEKAKLFDDQENYLKIINTKSPAQAKQNGRKVLNFNEAIWKENRCQIVVRGNLAKFDQNQNLKEYLIGTKTRILVEASPVDTIWGIGLSSDNSNCKNPLLWKGDNLLGFALMEVRDLINK